MPGSVEPEALTRKKRIDPLVRAAGWVIVPSHDSPDVRKYDRHLALVPDQLRAIDREVEAGEVPGETVRTLLQWFGARRRS